MTVIQYGPEATQFAAFRVLPALKISAGYCPVKISTKYELKPLVEYFKDFSENYFKEDSSEFKDFNLSENKFSKRISLDEYALLKNRSQLTGENLMLKLRANSILKALELDFHRKSFTCGNNQDFVTSDYYYC